MTSGDNFVGFKVSLSCVMISLTRRLLQKNPGLYPSQNLLNKSCDSFLRRPPVDHTSGNPGLCANVKRAIQCGTLVCLPPPPADEQRAQRMSVSRMEPVAEERDVLLGVVASPAVAL